MIALAPLLIALSLAIGTQTSYAADASLVFAPATGVYPIGATFDVTVRVNSPDEPVGTADATVAYNPDDLEFMSFSTEGSIFSSIITAPDERRPGELKISGMMARNREPFIGNDGLFVTLTFRALRNRSTEVRFVQGGASAPLVAGVGAVASNFLSTLGAATYTLVPKEVVPAQQATAIAFAEEVPGFEITPVPVPADEWFATTSVKLTWTLPEGIEAMRTGEGDSPTVEATKRYEVPVSSVTLNTLKEGVQYFALQLLYGDEWGPVVRFPIKVDLTEPATLLVREKDRSDAADPRVTLAIDAQDALSGIGAIDYKVDEGEAMRVTLEGGLFEPEGLTAGEHTLTFIAYDRAGNSTSTSLTLKVATLEPPSVTEVPKDVMVGNPIVLKGSTFPDATVQVHVSYNDGEAQMREVKSDLLGGFTVTATDAARAGAYTIWFTVKDARGAMSEPSFKYTVKANQPVILLFGSLALSYLSVIVPLVVLLLALIFGLVFIVNWWRRYRVSVRRETIDAERVVHREFDLLRKDLVRQLGYLEQARQYRELTREEMRLLKELGERLDLIEERIAAEIEDIEHVPEHARRFPEDASDPTPSAPATARSTTRKIPIEGVGHTVNLARR